MLKSSLCSSTPNPWTTIGSPGPGTVSALATGLRGGRTIFAGTRTGLYRTNEVDRGAQTRWQRLPNAPLEILSLGISPNYTEDSTLLAGTGQGLFISRDGGEHWQAAQTPLPAPVVLCFCFSPNYRSDGIILAGTLEDGVYYTDSRGEHWSYRGFGLLDAAVYSLAISPDFARDETVFAGTESALYYSYNGARAWKLLDFPEGAAPILSLALSPHFACDHTLFAGTEQHSLYQSADRGKSWQKTELPATCVNALARAPEDGTLFAATNAGLFCSGDGGASWNWLFDRPDAFSLAASDGLLIAGLVDQGAWLTTDRLCSAQRCNRNDRTNWQPFFTLPARPLTGMVLSPRFDIDPAAFLYGPQEGLWRTVDGGHSWTCLNEGLPGLDIRSLALSPTFSADRVLIAASGDGILTSEDGGDSWFLAVSKPASLVAFAPGGRLVAIISPDGEIQIAPRPKGPWQRLASPWGQTSQVLAIAVDDGAWLRVALLDQTGEWLSIWAGEPGRLEQVLRRPRSPGTHSGGRAIPVARFWVPPNVGSDGVWFASLEGQVWEFRSPSGGDRVSAGPIFDTWDGSTILALTGSQVRAESGDSLALFAGTGQTVYRFAGTGDWHVVSDFGDERAVDLALSPMYPDDATIFALLLGGMFCRGILVADGGDKPSMILHPRSGFSMI